MPVTVRVLVLPGSVVCQVVQVVAVTYTSVCWWWGMHCVLECWCIHCVLEYWCCLVELCVTVRIVQVVTVLYMSVCWWWGMHCVLDLECWCIHCVLDLECWCIHCVLDLDKSGCWCCLVELCVTVPGSAGSNCLIRINMLMMRHALCVRT